MMPLRLQGVKKSTIFIIVNQWKYTQQNNTLKQSTAENKQKPHNNIVTAGGNLLSKASQPNIVHV